MLHPLSLSGGVVAPGQPWIKCLMMVKVVPMCLRALLDMAPIQGFLFIEEYHGPVHFQQPPTLPHLGPIKGLPPRPSPGYGFLGHWGGPCPGSSWV